VRNGGVSRIRTGDPLLAKQVLYQLSYNPGLTMRDGIGTPEGYQESNTFVGLGGVEPPTSRLSGVRSNHLSYSPRKNQPARSFLQALARIVRADQCLERTRLMRECKASPADRARAKLFRR
jgi:hypothetical protein